MFKSKRDGGFYEDPIPHGITLNFNVCDLTGENGAIRQIPGTHLDGSAPPHPDQEPAWMKYSYVKPPGPAANKTPQLNSTVSVAPR